MLEGWYRGASSALCELRARCSATTVSEHGGAQESYAITGVFGGLAQNAQASAATTEVLITNSAKTSHHQCCRSTLARHGQNARIMMNSFKLCS